MESSYGYFQNQCRLCFRRDVQMQPIFPNQNLEESVVAYKIFTCTSIELPKDNEDLVAHICFICTSMLEEFYFFRVQCLKNNEMYQANKSMWDRSSLQIMDVRGGVSQQNAAPMNTNGFEQHVPAYSEPELQTPIVKLEFEGSTEINSNEVVLNIKTEPFNVENEPSTQYIEKRNEEMLESVHQKTPFECDMCNATFRNNDYFRAHMKMHSADRPYECDQCGKRFTTSGNMKTHKLFHSNERPYKCKLCGKSFHTRYNLNTHTKVTHAPNRPFQCNMCHKKYQNEEEMILHQVIHSAESAYKCNICQKVFSQASYLAIHSRTHSGEKPYKCDFCDKRFITAGNLNVHRVVHTNEKKFRCDTCNKSFAHSSNLIVHKKRHERDYLSAKLR